MKKQSSSFTTEVLRILNSKIVRYDINQTELASAIGVSQSQLSKILRGTRPMDVDVFAGICEALDLNISEVVEEADSLTSDKNLSIHFSRIPAASKKLVLFNSKLPEPETTESYQLSYFHANDKNKKKLSKSIVTDNSVTLSDDQKERKAMQHFNANLDLAANYDKNKEMERDYYPDAGA